VHITGRNHAYQCAFGAQGESDMQQPSVIGFTQGVVAIYTLMASSVNGGSHAKARFSNDSGLFLWLDLCG
jgi:hypothetical protein